MKIAVYTIALNEEHFIERWAKSCEEADYRLVVDTGSSDDTVAVANANGCHTATIKVSPWRFDDARNAALALIPDDIDFCISLDADEVLTPNWREAFGWLDKETTRPRYKYVWSWNADWTEGLVYSGDKVHKRHGYRWIHPVHEVLKPSINEVQQWFPLVIHHYPDPTKSRSQYLPLLELSVQENPDDDRNLFYLGREYMFNGQNELAIHYLEKHLKLSTWRAERSTSMRYIARMTNDKEHWLLRACAEAPERREPWNDLALYYYEARSWESTLYCAKRCLSIVDKPLEYLCESEAWGSQPHDLAGISAWNLGDYEYALTQMLKALELAPNDERIRNNTAVMSETILSLTKED